MIIIYYNHITASSFSISDYWDYGLPQSYLQYLLRFKNQSDALLSIRGRMLLKKIVNEEFNAQLDFQSIDYNQFGKPFLNNSAFDFSISHAGDVAVCAVSDTGPIGIDLERVHQITLADYKGQMTDFEWNRLLNSSEQDAFFCYWTQKEAVLKAIGIGLGIELNSFEVISGTTIIKGDKWFVMPIKLPPAYICHVASDKNIETADLTLKEVCFG